MKKTCIPILLFHRLHQTENNRLTLSKGKFEQMLSHLAWKNYKTVFFHELLDPHFVLPKKPIILTFDDGYSELKEILLPLMKKYKMKASIFLPVGAIGGENKWDGGGLKLLTWDELKSFPQTHFEFGFHSYHHGHLSNFSEEELRKDIQLCFKGFSEREIPCSPVLAYPFGSFPRKNKIKKDFFKILSEEKIQFALRIGNKTEQFPFVSPYEIKRLDISGESSLLRFKWKLLSFWPF